MVDLERVLERTASQKNPGTVLATSQKRWRLHRIKLPGKSTVETAIYARGPVEDWLAVREHLVNADFTVPELYAFSRERGDMLVEDLGTLRVIDLSPAEATRRYDEALGLLLKLQREILPGKHTDHPPFCRALDESELTTELDRFVDSALPKLFSVPSRGSHVEPIRIELARLARELASQPRYTAHRSFIGRNLHVTPAKRLVLTGFDQALMAPPHYDLVSLFYDGWGGPTPAQREEHLRRHAEEGKEFLPAWDGETLRHSFGRMAAQRILGELGRIAEIFDEEELRGLGAVVTRLVQNLRRLCQANEDLTSLRDPLVDLIPELGAG